MKRETIGFPADFLWGAATSAYQIEGAPLEDGAGPSIWHRFAHTAGRTANGDTGDVACDHYHRYGDDVALMRDIGLGAYRFSISWSRVFPEGRGKVNARGLAFYDRLADALLSAGIQPFPTLYHWDLPAALDDRGGWLNPDVADWFADYARTMYQALGDRVTMWTTLNEPWVVMDGGYMTGVLAPGHRNRFEAPIVTHNLLRAHGTAVDAYRSECRHRIGMVVNLEPKYPSSDRPEDLAATSRADAYMNRHYLDPVCLGRYPDELREIFGDAWIDHSAEDMALVSRPIDFVGVNYYSRNVVRDDPSALPVRAVRVRQSHRLHTSMDWEVYPQGLEDTLRWVTSRYENPPIFITENGAAFADHPVASGETVEDPLRLDYYREHLRAMKRAMMAGSNVRGYFAWSLLDNFEWAEGYGKRFGIVHVDFETQRRTLKRSARYYSDVIRSQGAILDEIP